MMHLKLAVLLCSVMVVSCNDYFTFNYHSVGVEELCLSFQWNFVGQTCTPLRFILQGFEPQKVLTSQLNSPKLSINSSTATFSIIRSLAAEENLYYRVVGVDANEMICEANSLSGYLNYSFLETGSQIPSLIPPSTSLCFHIPEINIYYTPVMIWQNTSEGSVGDCACLPSFDFASCLVTCGSTYQFVVNGSRICLNTSSLQGNETLKVHFTIEEDVCSEPCPVTTILASYLLSLKAAYNSQISHSSLHLESIARRYNHTVHVNGSLHIENPALNPPQQLVWTYNGDVVDSKRNPRMNITADSGLTLSDAQPSDAGYYAFITSSQLQCESIQFKVTVEYITVSNLVVVADTDAIVFNITAIGYPDVELLMWKTELGNIVPESQYRSTVTRQEFNVTVVSTLSISEQECGGFYAVFMAFNNSVMNSDTIHCPAGSPKDPVVQLERNNNTMCCSSYSHPDYPVGFYSVNITDSSMLIPDITHYRLNDSQCFVLSSEVYPHVCVKLQIVVIAWNSLGYSNPVNYTIQDDLSCQNLLKDNSSLVQVFLFGVSNCMQWIDSETTDKVVDLSNGLLSSIRSQCQCDYPDQHLHQPHLECTSTDSNRVIFRSYVIAYNGWNVNTLVEMVDNFVSTQSSITVQGEVLGIDKNCPVEGTSTICSTSTSTMPNVYVLTGISTAAFFTMAIFFLVLAICVVTVIKRHKRKLSEVKVAAPIYEEVSDVKLTSTERKKAASVPVYEQVMEFSTCEAYEATKMAKKEISELTDCPAYGITY